jgi:prepilin-type N-terminal cleavage/methylation domain-containing protein
MKFVSSAARRGFTLIELLVVIAIIGILSSVVLASLNTARNKGADAAVKSNLEQARAQAELFYDANGNAYESGTSGLPGDVCSATGLAGGTISGIYKSVNAAATAVGISTVTIDSASVGGPGIANCNSVPTAWAASVPLKTSGAGYFCVDSTGAATTSPASLIGATDDTAC